MAKKIPVRLHIGVDLMNPPEGVSYGGIRTTLTDSVSETKINIIAATVEPVVDEGGNLQVVAEFEDVQSGDTVTCTAEALDNIGNPIGPMVTHVALVDTVPDDAGPKYLQPSFLFISI